MADHYATLGVPKNADEAAIKRAFRKAARKAHPDVGGSADKMADLNKAYATLGDSGARARYDATGEDGMVYSLDFLAQQSVLESIAQTLDRVDENTDIVRMLRDGLLQRIAENEAQKRANLARIAKLGLQRKRVKAKGINLFHLVIDQRVRDLTTRNDGIDHAEKVIRRAIELLDEHGIDVAGFDLKPRTAPISFSYSTGTAGTTL